MLRRRRGSSPRAPADLSRRESRYLARLRGKYFLRLAFYMDQKRGYRGLQTLANSREVQCEHHLVAGLFVCEKSVLKMGRGVVNTAVSRRPLQSCSKLSQKLFKKLSGYAQTK